MPNPVASAPQGFLELPAECTALPAVPPLGHVFSPLSPRDWTLLRSTSDSCPGKRTAQRAGSVNVGGGVPGCLNKSIKMDYLDILKSLDHRETWTSFSKVGNFAFCQARVDEVAGLALTLYNQRSTRCLPRYGPRAPQPEPSRSREFYDVLIAPQCALRTK